MNRWITLSFIRDLVYCMRHTSINIVYKFVTHLDRFAQDLDATIFVLYVPMRFHMMWEILNVQFQTKWHLCCIILFLWFTCEIIYLLLLFVQHPPFCIQDTLSQKVPKVLAFNSLLYGQFDNVISDHILQHHEFVLSYEHSTFEYGMTMPMVCNHKKLKHSF